MIDRVISRVLSKAPLLVKSHTWWHHSIRGTREVMKIFLDVPNVTAHGMYYVGMRPRLASVTAVKFISDSLLVASHMVGQSIFLIQFSRFTGQYKVPSQMYDLAHVFRLTSHQFYHIYDLKGFNFPPGIDIDKGNQLVAVTNYGDHSIDLRRL